jgi:hypothetical protein
LRVTVFRAHHRINASPDNTTPADDDAVSQFRSTRSHAAMIDTSSRACASSTEASADHLGVRPRRRTVSGFRGMATAQAEARSAKRNVNGTTHRQKAPSARCRRRQGD